MGFEALTGLEFDLSRAYIKKHGVGADNANEFS
jgi:hypothetical protein